MSLCAYLCQLPLLLSWQITWHKQLKGERIHFGIWFHRNQSIMAKVRPGSAVHIMVVRKQREGKSGTGLLFPTRIHLPPITTSHKAVMFWAMLRLTVKINHYDLVLCWTHLFTVTAYFVLLVCVGVQVLGGLLLPGCVLSFGPSCLPLQEHPCKHTVHTAKLGSLHMSHLNIK